MDEKNKKDKGTEAVFAEWMKSATDFWGNITKIQTGWPDFLNSGGSPQKGTFKQTQKAWETGSKISRKMFSALSKPENMESVLKGMDSMPDFMTTMVQQTWEGFFELQKQWMERAAKAGQQTKAYNFEDIDQDTFKTIRQIYENEFQKFLNIPTLGLNRSHQEKVNRLIDKFNIFQTTLNEFLYIFYVPIEKTSAVMQEKIEQMAESGEVYTDFKDYYNMWIKILEGHYMTLLKSPEYTKVMDSTIDALVQYKDAKEDMLCDVIQKFPVPTNKDMDALYKDIYLLKKKVRDLSRKLDSDH